MEYNTQYLYTTAYLRITYMLATFDTDASLKLRSLLVQYWPHNLIVLQLAFIENIMLNKTNLLI